MASEPASLNRSQQVALVLLRTLVGWHFLYEGFFKLWGPAWSRAGAPLAHFTAAGYLKAASGPFAGLFHALGNSRFLPYVDTVVAVALVLAGLSLILGLFTRAGALLALALLALFYLSAIPTAGVPQPGTEGAYLLVSKNLVEAAAVLVILCFGTGRIAGLDLLWRPARAATPSEGNP
jgi:thiosulfate dehydrogenase (quinone) large subunit